jgi:hypothetical protein
MTVLDCAGNAVSGVSLQLTPAAGKIIYSDVFGIPISNGTATSNVGTAWVLNAPVGTATLTASKAGLTFIPHDIEILDGDLYWMGSTMRPVP